MSDLQFRPQRPWQLRLYTIIFEADTVAGRRFDLAVMVAIVVSVAAVVLDSVQSLDRQFGTGLKVLEWLLTLAFTLEYALRLACVRRPWAYATSFFGIIDLLSVLPTYLTLFFPEVHYLLDVRVLRLLRIFRVLKLTNYVSEYTSLGRALVASRRKIQIFLSFVLMVVLIMGTLMYVIEGPEHGFTSIPTSMYWAVTTMTTVGFGDLTPKTDLGRLLSSMMMLLGWGVLAVPTGIVTAEMSSQRHARLPTTRGCPSCLQEGHTPEARFCWHCGHELPHYQLDPLPPIRP